MIETILCNLLLAVFFLHLCFQRLLLSEFVSIFQLWLTPSAMLLQITSGVLHTTIIPCSLDGELLWVVHHPDYMLPNNLDYSSPYLSAMHITAHTPNNFNF